MKLIVQRRAVTSFEDMRTVHGTVYETFQEAARAHGLLDIENEADLAMAENIHTATAAELRDLFCIPTVRGYATAHMVRDGNAMRTRLYADFLNRDPARDEQLAYRLLLEDIQVRLGGNEDLDYRLQTDQR